MRDEERRRRTGRRPTSCRCSRSRTPTPGRDGWPRITHRRAASGSRLRRRDRSPNRSPTRRRSRSRSLGMDRRAEGQARRRMVAPEVHASRAEEHLVEDQPREGGRAHRGGQHEAVRARGSRAREDGMGAGRPPTIPRAGQRCRRIWRRRWQPTPRRPFLRDAGVAQPLRRAVPHPHGEEAGDASSSHREVRRACWRGTRSCTRRNLSDVGSGHELGLPRCARREESLSPSLDRPTVLGRIKAKPPLRGGRSLAFASKRALTQPPCGGPDAVRFAHDAGREEDAMLKVYGVMIGVLRGCAGCSCRSRSGIGISGVNCGGRPARWR